VPRQERDSMGVIVERAGEEKDSTRQELGANKNPIRTTNALRKLSTLLLLSTLYSSTSLLGPRDFPDPVSV